MPCKCLLEDKEEDLCLLCLERRQRERLIDDIAGKVLARHAVHSDGEQILTAVYNRIIENEEGL